MINQQNIVSGLRLAFLSRASFDNGLVSHGGILVTDGETKPLEFRCTSPIRPSSLQKVLYGKTLDGHMALELIGLPLIKRLSEKPDDASLFLAGYGGWLEKYKRGWFLNAPRGR